MTTPSTQHVTELLLAWRQGEESALEKLTPVVYEQLRRLAHRYMVGERAAQTHADVGAFPVAGTFTLSGAEADAITNYADLYIRIVGNKV